MKITACIVKTALAVASIGFGRALPESGLGLGETCNFHRNCASGVCHWQEGVAASGICVECTSDDHCEGQGESGPGEHPRAFCFENTCSQWKRGQPLDERGYPLWFEGTDEATWIPRNVLEEGNLGEERHAVMEQVWHWDLKQQPEGTEIVVDDKFVSIPLNAQTIAAYSRTYHQYEEHETGIVTAVFLNNPISLVTPYAVAGMIEKYHTLSYSGNWSTVRSDDIEAVVNARTPQENEQAQQEYTERSYKMGGFYTASGLINAQLESGQDQLHLDQIRDYVEEVKEESFGDFESLGWALHSVEAQQALADAPGLASLKSENHCKHFESGAGIEVNSTHISIPLDKPFTTLSGEMVYSPTYYLGLNAGINLARYNAHTDTLEFYYRASQSYRGYSDGVIPSEELPYESGIWVTPVADNYPVSTMDGRTDEYYTDIKPETPEDFLDIPVDYSIYDRSQEESCPEELQDRLDNAWEKAMLIQAQESSNPVATFSNLASLLLVTVEGAPCGANYMRSEYKSGVVGLELNEYSVWVHLILEVDVEYTEQIVMADFWDDWMDILK